VILVGEMRTWKTISTDCLAPKTGHWFLHLHTSGRDRNIQRIIAVLPSARKKARFFAAAATLKPWSRSVTGSPRRRSGPRACGRIMIATVTCAIAL